METPFFHPFESFHTFTPSKEEIEGIYRRNFTGRDIPKSKPYRELNIEIVLSPEQALVTERLPFEVPLASRCNLCMGTGRTGFFDCECCDGQGLTWETARLDIIVPRPLRDGVAIPVSLRHLGVRNLYMNVHVRIASG